MKPNSLLIVRADGNETVGYGHVMRCCALAEEWQARGGQCVFVTWSSDSFVLAMLAPFDIRSDTAPSGMAMIDYLSKRNRGPVWVVADVGERNVQFILQARRCGSKALVFCDGREAKSPADIGVNAARNPRYACIRREIVAVRGKREIPERARRVLVATGGTNNGDLERTICRMSADAAAKHQMEITTARRDNMPKLLQWADVAISAAGHTAWELACVGLPTALVTIADNQIPVAERMVEAGAAISLGDVSSLRRWFADPVARTAQRDAGLALVDGRGARRVVDMMLAEGDQ